MIIEGAQVTAQNLAISAASTNTTPVDLGLNGDYYDAQPWLFVNLTAGFTAGAIASVKVQTADAEAFAAAVDVMTVTVPTTIAQTAPAKLIVMKLPRGMKRWMRLVVAASGTPAGGAVFAGLSTGAPT
ncbi:MAG: hypothetical protein LBO03_09260 [Acidaminococcales bacterium]|jgi:hypothetical protein|nr:hypothetical protein [Acidaminococcales bacterium]